MERWIEEKVEEFKNLEVEKLSEQAKLSANEKIEELKENIEEMKAEQVRLEVELREKTHPFTEKIAEIETKQAEIKTKISDDWNLKDKTYKANLATVSRRTTTSLVIVDKKKLVDFLVINNQVEKCVKSFDILQLKVFKKSNKLSDEVAKLKPNHTVSIKLKEDLKETIEDSKDIMKEIEEEFGSNE